MDPARGLETPRQAIRDLVNEVFDFRAAAAVALGSVWLSRVPEDQDEFTRLFAIFLERGFIAMVGSKARVAGGVNIQYWEDDVSSHLFDVPRKVSSKLSSPGFGMSTPYTSTCTNAGCHSAGP